MKDNIHFSSNILTLSAAQMTVSGILVALCGWLIVGGLFWAAALCLLISAYHFRGVENKEKEQNNDKQETL